MFRFALALLLALVSLGGALMQNAGVADDLNDVNATLWRSRFIQGCLHTKDMASAMEPPLPRNITLLLEDCYRSSKNWFGKFYFEQWKRSWQKRAIDKVLKYVNPTFLFVTLILLLIAEVILYRLDARHQRAMWTLLFWSNSLTLGEFVLFYIPTFAAKNLHAFDLANTVAGCKLLTFSRSIATNGPSWLLILLLVDQIVSMAQQRRTTLTPFSVRCVILGLLSALIVINVHTLWLYTYYPGSTGGGGTCTINTDPVQSVVFNGIYPVLLDVLHDLLPLIFSGLALLVVIVMWLCRKGVQSPDVVTVFLIGLSYVLFDTPQTVEWLLRRVSQTSETKSLEKFIKQFTINVLAHTWSFFRYFFFVPLLFVFNQEYRNETLVVFTAGYFGRVRNRQQRDAIGEEGEEAIADELAATSSTTGTNLPMLQMNAKSAKSNIWREPSFDTPPVADLLCGCVRRQRCSRTVMCVCECLPVYRTSSAAIVTPSPGGREDGNKTTRPMLGSPAAPNGCWPHGKFSSHYNQRVKFPLECRCEWLRAASRGKKRRDAAQGKQQDAAATIEDREAMEELNNVDNFLVIVTQTPQPEEGSNPQTEIV